MTSPSIRSLLGVYRSLRRRAPLLALAAAIVLFALSPFALRRGLVHAEAYLIIPHYLSERPLLQKIFDPIGADAGCYSARELSYFFDYLDCAFIAWSVRQGWPHFLSLHHYVACAAMGLAMWLICRRIFRLDTLVSALLVLLFLTTPAVFLGGSFFRSAKSGAALWTLCAVALVFTILRRDTASHPPPSLGAGHALAIGGAVLLMGLYDRQGFALGLLLLGCLSLLAWRLRSRAAIVAGGATACGLAGVSIYNHVIGPALIELINGYRPSMEFQRLPWQEMLTDPANAASIVLYAPVLALDNFRFLVGGLPLALGALLLVAAWWRLAPELAALDSARISRAAARIGVALVPLALMGMNALMILRVKAMLNLDYRRIYYGLPSIVVFWLLVTLAVFAINRGRTPAKRWLPVVLAILVSSNLVGLLEHRAIIRRGLYLDQHLSSPGIVAALGHLDRIDATKTQPPYWPVGPQGSAADDGLVRFFRRLQLREQKVSAPKP